MSLPQSVRPDRRFEQEDSVAQFVWLVAQYEWSKEELKECGVEEADFRKIVRLMRFRLVAEGYVVV